MTKARLAQSEKRNEIHRLADLTSSVQGRLFATMVTGGHRGALPRQSAGGRPRERDALRISLAPIQVNHHSHEENSNTWAFPARTVVVVKAKRTVGASVHLSRCKPWKQLW
jgi:hypothetical protein